MKLKTQDQDVKRRIFEMQSEICKAMGHPVRLAIVDALHEKERPAADLIAELALSKANLSKHIALLISGGVVQSRREGRQIFYRLADPEILRACAIMREILQRRLYDGTRLAAAIDKVVSGH